MIKIFLLSALLALSACSSAPQKAPDVVGPESSVPTQVVPTEFNEAVVDALMPKITITEFTNHTEKEKIRNTKAIERIIETVSGQCFKDVMLKRPLIQTNGRTNAQVIEHILKADVTVRLEMYRNRLKKTVGYTYANTNKIWANRKYHDNFDPCDACSNFAHGYGHDDKPSKSRPFSVPYSLNVAIEKCCVEKR
jgi:hypothetical protein